MPDQFLTVEEAANRLRLRPSTIRRQLRNGALRGVKRGHIWRVPESALSESLPRIPLQDEERPFARALILVAQLEREMGAKPKRVAGVNDVAADLRHIRKAQVP